MTADEHIILRKVRELVNWGQTFATPKVAVRVDGANTQGKGRATLAEYEKAFGRIPLAYRFIDTDVSTPEGTVVFDARQPYHEPCFQSDGGTLPDTLKEEIPLKLSEGYCASYTCSEDRRTLLAYVYNVTHHTDQPQWISGRCHRIPKAANLTLGLQNLPVGTLNYRIYNLNDKKLLRKGVVDKGSRMDFGNTKADYFVLVTSA